jgi:hypothetical protein
VAASHRSIDAVSAAPLCSVRPPHLWDPIRSPPSFQTQPKSSMFAASVPWAIGKTDDTAALQKTLGAAEKRAERFSSRRAPISRANYISIQA